MSDYQDDCERAHWVELNADMQRELRADQLRYYHEANMPQTFHGFGGWQGLKEFLFGCALILVLGLIFKYVLGVGS